MFKNPHLKTLITLVLLSSTPMFSQVGIGTTTPDTDAALEINSATGGVLLPRIPLTDTTSPLPLSTDVAGMIVYNTATVSDVTPGFYYNDGAIWVRLGAGGAPSNDWTLLGNAGTNPTTNFLGTTDAQDVVLSRNSTPKVRVQNTYTGFTDEIQIRDGSPDGGNNLVSIDDDNGNNDGRIRVYRNNQVQHIIDGQGPTIFNERSRNVDFRVESNTATDGFFLDGANGQITIGNYGAGAITAGVATQMLAVDVNGNIIEEPLPTGGSTDWAILGNSGLDGGNTTTNGVNFIGTTDNENLEFRTNNIQRGRFSSLGEFFVGTLNTVIPGDLMNAVSNPTFDWAVNGYSANDGSGTYGQVSSGGTIYAGVQGEYEGSNSQGPGVRGLTNTTGAGSDFTSDVTSGVHGQLGNANAYSFGVKGDTGTNLTRRTGGVLGTDLLASGALGYYANDFSSYSVYGFGQGHTTGGAGGRLASSSGINTHIGLGMNGGVMGGWIKGQVYGAMFSGDRFGSYTHGKSITNDSYVVVDQNSNGTKTATYASTSMSIDVQSRGVGSLSNGTSYIVFDNKFAQLIDSGKPIIVTVTPIGENNGVHLVSVNKNGFTIKENLNGNSNVKFNWVAIAEKTNKREHISKEILSKDFDKNMNGVMHDDSLNDDNYNAVWWNGSNVQFGKKAPRNKLKSERAKKRIKLARPKGVKK